MPIVGSSKQRRPTIFGHLVDVCAFVEEQFCRLDIAFASGRSQCRQTATTGANKTGNDDVLIVVIFTNRWGSRIRLICCVRILSCGPLAATLTLTTTLPSALALPLLPYLKLASVATAESSADALDFQLLFVG